ncbi:SsrA-binding protein [Marixanthomonas sp. SCSIO 43207]|uniref:SsrA-binding protein n=1 Tax=Marixanthomonas sp. SCSIO 43207 TaxID=2779360 RepID=UPI001CAA31C0|nr:SsrA-binding protein [Marixanthomonas sp. SCSIO 43207]UAB81312.1 SsrA-binding protein [Marixanthomonas sp. SCSIO 43207]
MKKKFFKTLAKLNKKLLPSFTKKGVDLSKASKVQLAIFGYKLWVTKNAVNQ